MIMYPKLYQSILCVQDCISLVYFLNETAQKNVRFYAHLLIDDTVINKCHYLLV